MELDRVALRGNETSVGEEVDTERLEVGLHVRLSDEVACGFDTASVGICVALARLPDAQRLSRDKKGTAETRIAQIA